ncbi:MAG: response regulator [Burkholderiales bacterium]
MPFAPSARQTVFYVEDQPEDVMLMEALINVRPRLRLVAAANGTQALQMAPQAQPALLLLDLHLPDCDGRELLRRLRLQPAFARVPAVVVTADDSFHPAGTGFCEAWRKPLHVSHVLGRLDHFLGDGGVLPVPVPKAGLPPRHSLAVHR